MEDFTVYKALSFPGKRYFDPTLLNVWVYASAASSSVRSNSFIPKSLPDNIMKKVLKGEAIGKSTGTCDPDVQGSAFPWILVGWKDTSKYNGIEYGWVRKDVISLTGTNQTSTSNNSSSKNNATDIVPDLPIINNSGLAPDRVNNPANGGTPVVPALINNPIVDQPPASNLKRNLLIGGGIAVVIGLVAIAYKKYFQHGNSTSNSKILARRGRNGNDGKTSGKKRA